MTTPENSAERMQPSAHSEQQDTTTGVGPSSRYLLRLLLRDPVTETPDATTVDGIVLTTDEARDPGARIYDPGDTPDVG